MGKRDARFHNKVRSGEAKCEDYVCSFGKCDCFQEVGVERACGKLPGATHLLRKPAMEGGGQDTRSQHHTSTICYHDVTHNHTMHVSYS